VLAAVVRYTANGALDRIFSGDGMLVEGDRELQDDEINVGIYDIDVAVQKDGKVLVAGVANAEDGGEDGNNVLVVIRYTYNGKRDSTFGSNGKVTAVARIGTGSGPKIAVQSDGRIVVAAPLPNGSGITIYNPDGSKFSSGPGIPSSDNSYLTNLSAYSDGGYVYSYKVEDGNTGVYSTRFGDRLVKLDNEDFYGAILHTIVPNGKIALIGNAGGEGKVVQLNADGSLDNSFGAAGYVTIPGFIPREITSDSKGKIILQGARDGFGNGFMRLNTNGSVDKTFGKDGFVQSDYGGPIAVYGNRLFATSRGNNIAAYLLYTDPRYVKVNLYANATPYQNREWNNWHNLHDLHFNNFYYSDSTISSIDAVMSNRNGVNDNGAAYGSGMAPAGVLRHSSYAIGSRTITLSGLTLTKRYSIELYGSRNAYSTDSTVFTINGVSKKIGTYRNFTDKAVFSNLTPNAQGQIVVTISSTKTYNYINGFILTENFAATSTEAVTRTAFKKEISEVGTLQVTALPNPAPQSFSLQLKSSSTQPAQLRIFDAAGRIVEVKQNIASNTPLSVGAAYKSGVYYAEIIQGNTRKLVKLVKQ
jgi:uncharacterized delta-60 repeat protein